ncbi:hypothetical protein AGMMS50256_00460 [Betaproteobacteria bacterium]|nr:hypothetical protein AGMMS50256_00460 [Betaproteobacteria bacterium]
MPHVSRYRAACSAIGRAVVFATLMFASAGLHAASGKATDEAFAALLSMPGAEPEEGRWIFPVPEDFKPESAQESESEPESESESESGQVSEAASEAELIAYLAKKKKAGADFNAYRHYGTLLHHAIRAGFTATAVWLLENGADPNKSRYENALALSLRYQRDDLARLLQERYGLKTTPVKKVVYPHDIDPTTLPAKNLSASDIEMARKIFQSTAWGMRDYAKSDSTRKRVKQWTTFVSRLPSGAYVKLMDDDSALASLVTMHADSAAELDKALADLPPKLVKRRAGAACRCTHRGWQQPEERIFAVD